MSRSYLPLSDTDRIAAATTAIAIAAIVGVILTVFPDPIDVSLVAAHGMLARHVDEGNRTTSRDGVFPSSKASARSPDTSRGML